MAYQVLARKWRPRNFHEVMGQQHVLQALANALDQGRLHHAYLLSGTRGVGKTTIARILAKCLNCETGITSRPCGECSACREIDQGNFVDLLEIDAASRTKVEDTRELLDNVQYRPARGRFKIYLIDEVHMLSRHSFNALLKTLEEPPEHVKFLLATTDPQKLPVTILSRCLQFHLKALTREQIVEQLQRVLQAESLPFSPAALGLLAKAAQGSMRDALSLSDQAIAYGNGELQVETVQQMLGTLDHRQLYSLLSLLATRDGALLMQQVGALAELAPDYDQLHVELASLLHRTAMWQLLGQQTDPTADDTDELQQLAEQIPPEELQLYYQIALNGRKELPLAPDGRSALEMTLLRMLAFAPRSQERAPSHSQQKAIPEIIAPSLTAPVIPRPVVVAPIATTSIVQERVTEDLAMHAKLLQEQAELMAQAEQQMQPVTENINIQPVPVPQKIQEQVVVAPEPAAIQSTSSAETQNTGVQDVLRLRNQLRSRRQQAENQSDSYSSTTASSNVASVAPVYAPKPRIEAASVSPTKIVSPQSVATSVVEATNLSDDLPPWELPPLDSYQDGFFAADNAPESPMPVAESARVRKIDSVQPIVPVVQPNLVPVSAQSVIDEDDEAVWHSNELLARSDDLWAQTVANLPVGGRVRQLAMQGVVTNQQADSWHLQIRNEARHLAQPRMIQELAEAISVTLSQAINLQLEAVALLSKPCPAEIEQHERVRLQKDAEALLLADPNVQFLQQRFGATLDDGTIQPLKTNITVSNE
jgi:DNA polymerase III subunit gamma/tau